MPGLGRSHASGERSIRREPTKPNGTELLEAPGQSRVVGDREIDLEELGQATEKALGLAKRKVEDHANRQCGLDRNITVGALATGLALGRNSPGVERIIRKPDSQVATLL